MWSTVSKDRYLIDLHARRNGKRLMNSRKTPTRLMSIALRVTAAALAIAGFTAPAAADPVLLKPARVFDGAAMHEGWSVIVDGAKIVAAGPNLAAPAGADTIEHGDGGTTEGVKAMAPRHIAVCPTLAASDA